jgi:hypothetical protein
VEEKWSGDERKEDDEQMNRWTASDNRKQRWRRNGVVIKGKRVDEQMGSQ